MTGFPDVLNIEQAANYLGLGNDAIYKLAQKKQIPAFKVRGKWRFAKVVLLNWIQENSTKQQPQLKRASGSLWTIK